ncbi:MAG: hypothetical protein NXI04_14975 [Planctomycetaceae bacterium]|nr:hypothetical protein [Planctomycetaceae bacterium]
MTRSASVFEDDHIAGPDEFSDSADWLSDDEQLASWQEQLVDSCHAISRQLTEIQSDLHRDLAPAIPFRLIKGQSHSEDFQPRLV